MIPEETVISKIYLIRGKKVMLDSDLAEFYGVETRRLKEQVRRNMERFPEDFMIELTKKELEDFRKQFGNTSKVIMGLRIAPFAFTEHGILMLASVLNAERAIQVNIQLVRVFNKMREMLLTHKDILLKLEAIEKKVSGQDEKVMIIFNYLKQFIQEQKTPRKKIGFKQQGKK